MKILADTILIRDFTYELPHAKIAEYPLGARDQSKLLVYDKGQITDERFYHLPQYLPADTNLVLNNTRVIEARMLFQKPTGGVIEIFCLEPHQQSMEQAMQQTQSTVWECLIGGASKWKPGQILEKTIDLDGASVRLTAQYVEKEEDHFLIQFRWELAHLPFVQIMHAAGAIPLPPYIKRKAEKMDWDRYQTVFGRHEGSVAAPTAALHFTEDIFRALRQKNIAIDYVTLHVGAGTFKPVKTETIAGHQMHGEPFTVKKETLEHLLASQKIVAVGTTSLRTLESLYWLGVKLKNDPDAEAVLHQWEAYELSEKYGSPPCADSFRALLDRMETQQVNEIHCKTSLIIVPGYAFKTAVGLITNFHQPQSTLLLLVAAFIGEDWKKVYQHALNHEYRFLSYGDSSLLWRKDQ